jgi:hypothetical protein
VFQDWYVGHLFQSLISSKIFEAMVMGLPILLALPAGEAAALVRNTGTGVVIPPEQPARLAEAVLQLREHPVLREQLSAAAQGVAPRYSRKRQAARMLAVFQAAMEGRRSVGELLPEFATVGPNVEEHVASVGGAESGAAGRRYERQDYLTRLLVSATYGAFGHPDGPAARGVDYREHLNVAVIGAISHDVGEAADNEFAYSFDLLRSADTRLAVQHRDLLSNELNDAADGCWIVLGDVVGNLFEMLQRRSRPPEPHYPGSE